MKHFLALPLAISPCSDGNDGHAAVTGRLAGVEANSTASSVDTNEPCEAVVVAKKAYQFPLPSRDYVKHFSYEHRAAAEVQLPHSFWMKVYGSVRPVSGWMGHDNGFPTPVYITQPDHLFQWNSSVTPPRPPVRGPVELRQVRGKTRIWRSLDPEIMIPYLLYVTFDAHPDVYVQITQENLDDASEGGDLWWNDAGVLHGMNIAGDWVEHAPAVAEAYKRLVIGQCTTKPVVPSPG